jgi:hypothetical protein
MERERGQARLYEQLRVLREDEGLGMEEAGAIVESTLIEVGLLEAAGVLDASAAARWRKVLIAEADVTRARERAGTQSKPAPFGHP